jgi:hypothetical protein
MAGTMPHAVFVETDLPGGVAAYAAELPGCAAFAESDSEAVAAIPRRVSRFGDWLRTAGEEAPRFEGGNWYEVERASGGAQRAVFSLDALPPSEDELARWMRWLELAREELADALDRSGAPGAVARLTAIVEQDGAFASELGAASPPPAGDPVADLYATRDALTDALLAAGASAEGVRRVLRIAIADDLRLAELLRAGDVAS